MRQIGAFEAKSKLRQLLDWVEAGEEVVITRRGRIVAKLVPHGLVPPGSIDRTRAQAAARRIRERRKGVTLGGLKIKELINEGRR
jgi:prevent-host-death family protein